MIQWATVLFLFFWRRSPYSKQFSEHRGAKVFNARIFLFYRRCAADFCFAPPYGKNQKVDRFIKRLQRKIKLFPRHILLSISASTGRVNVPANFDTKRKSPLRHKSAEKGLKSRASEVKYWLRKPIFTLWNRGLSASYTVGHQPCGVVKIE